MLLVFLHGLGQTPQAWQDQVTALPPGVKAVAPWLKGTRPARDEAFSVEGASDEVLRLLNQHGVERMALVGVSLGAVVALDAAVRAPDTISHLVLASGQVKPAAALKMQRLAFRLTPAARLRAAGVDKRRLLQAMDQLAAIDYTDRLDAVTARTLVLAGADDRAGVPAARALAAGIHGARLEIIAGAAQAPHTEAPARFNELLYGFLAEGDEPHNGRHE